MQFGRNKDETYIEKGSGGTAMKKETPEQQLNLLCRLIIRERDNSTKTAAMIRSGRMAAI